MYDGINWMSLDTGVCVKGFKGIVAEIFDCLIRYHVLYLRWTRINPIG